MKLRYSKWLTVDSRLGQARNLTTGSSWRRAGGGWRVRGRVHAPQLSRSVSRTLSQAFPMPVTVESNRSNGWFATTSTGRALSASEREFMALAAMLDRVRPAQVAPADTMLTGEGPDRLIAIIPHCRLAGVSIVVWHDPDSISVSWAQIGDLKYHDDLDLGFWVGRFARAAPEPISQAVQCVEQQLTRPIQVVATYGRDATRPIKVDFRLCDDSGVIKRIGGTRSGSFWSRILTRTQRAKECVVRFIDAETPPLLNRVNVHQWMSQ